MDFTSLESSLIEFRAHANSFLSQYEPLVLVLAPFLTLFVARIIRSFVVSLHDKGLKTILLGFFFTAIKLVPGVKRYIDAEKQKVVDKLQAGSKSKREGWRTELPITGLGIGVIEKLKDEKRNDVVWQGKCSGTVYIGGSESEGHFSLINEACSMIIPESAHSAYDKAAQYFNIKLWRVPVNKEFQADVKAIRRRINRNTILIVGSAPGFPHGIIDPIEELGELAFSSGICLHVDLCLGGFVLPFARKLGFPIPPIDFSVKGVTSISVDVHKYGLAPKGTSVVLYRNHDIRKHQFVAVTEWSGGLYVSPTMAGSRPGSLIAGAWAAMISLGEEGYLENTKAIMEVSKKIEKGIKDIPELHVIGKPDMTIVAFGSNTIDIFEVNDILSSKGWHLNALQRPNSIHICVTLQHVPVIEGFLRDLEESVQKVKENPGPLNGGLAPIYGAAGRMPDRGMVSELLVNYMDGTC
ncbi:sphingosine-1-phosphate lyase isoform X2 [Tripterygium wilfordii]|uniref:sphingosine-1-phosphate lyase isoform X2 n=1 Tax=Tripterygium wilfordii TaxID=458696 RepID=UPI0018F83DED|nr:sphingosine-1-phosphate lyase isoform X2 [Tripterygium wilfordii]